MAPMMAVLRLTSQPTRQPVRHNPRLVHARLAQDNPGEDPSGVGCSTIPQIWASAACIGVPSITKRDSIK